MMKSKTTVWLFFLIAALFTSCSSDESDSVSPEESFEKELIGDWYYSEDNEIYSFFIKGNGTGHMDLYEYLNKEWKTTKSDLQYTLSDKHLVVNIKPDYTWSGIIGITGNSLSLTNDDETVMMTKYDDGMATIDKLKKDIEDTWLDIEPTDSIQVDTIWHSENDLKIMVAGMYNVLKNFECNQLNLEHTRLTGKTLQGYHHEITPNSGLVLNTWASAYKVIQMANMIVGLLDNSNENFLPDSKRLAYLNEALLLRSFVYYNLAHLWGKAPFFTKTLDVTEIMDVPVYTQDKIFNYINNDLKRIDTVIGGDYQMNEDVSVALQAEIALWQNDKTKALQLLKNCKADYSIHLLPFENNDKIFHELFGDEMCIYSKQVIDLLIQEANGSDNKLQTDWLSFKSQWGYWAMLKRTQQAKTTAGCKEYELVMPIPQSEIDKNPNITQNPGYK